jgi:hypothetical protein
MGKFNPKSPYTGMSATEKVQSVEKVFIKKGKTIIAAVLITAAAFTYGYAADNMNNDLAIANRNIMISTSAEENFNLEGNDIYLVSKLDENSETVSALCYVEHSYISLDEIDTIYKTEFIEIASGKVWTGVVNENERVLEVSPTSLSEYDFAIYDTNRTPVENQTIGGIFAIRDSKVKDNATAAEIYTIVDNLSANKIKPCSFDILTGEIKTGFLVGEGSNRLAGSKYLNELIRQTGKNQYNLELSSQVDYSKQVRKK